MGLDDMENAGFYTAKKNRATVLTDAL